MSDIKRRLFKNTLILTLTTLLIRGIGMGFNAFLAGRIGAEGVGLYQLMLSIYVMALMLAASGVRLATTRLSAQAMASNQSPRRALVSCLKVSGAMGLLAMALLYLLAAPAARLLGDEAAAYPLRILSPALPFVAMSTALGGYFTARRRMSYYGAVQIIEQLARVGFTILGLSILPQTGESALLAVAMGMTAAEGISFSLAFLICLIDLRRNEAGAGQTGLLKQIVRIALPDAVGAWLRSALSTTEQLLIPKQLKRAAPEGNALATYGLIQGMAMPIITLPAAPITALASMLVPELAQMQALKEYDGIRRTVRRTLKWSFLYSGVIGALLLIFAQPLSTLIYASNEAAPYIRALALLIPLLYTDTVTDYLLKSLDEQVYCMRLNTVDCILRIVIVLFLIPHAGTLGYILLLYFSEAFNFSFSLSRLLKVIKNPRTP